MKRNIFSVLNTRPKRESDMDVEIYQQRPGKRSFGITPGGGGDSHMKQTGMLVVSLRGVNFGFWSRLGCSGQSANNLSHQGLV